MSIYDDLEAVEIKDPLLGLYLKDINTLSSKLQALNNAADVLPLLKLELAGKQRMSFISRIYGRYRKLIPKQDYELMNRWRLQWEKKSAK